ncbi:hypothetical protein DXG01_007921 [Tephrocybe rancida]|nr:hypothetical protein DXG01_007921 [Tephrocybe rancida]
MTSYPGFTLDLNARRLVQLDGQVPFWVSELDKVQMKAKGIRFFDILAGKANSGFFPVSKRSPTRQLRRHSGSRLHSLNSIILGDSIQLLSESMEPPPPTMELSLSARTKTARTCGLSFLRLARMVWKAVALIPTSIDASSADDGSGSVTILEAYRALIAANFHPDRAVEFHWYSAEEGGLLGSQAVAQDYEGRSVNVLAMSQFDMTAWVKRGSREEVGIITDYVDPELDADTLAVIS